MKTILAFGDSLTWGADPATGGRHPHESLWPVVLERGLRGEARVVAEGLGGRTTCFDDHAGPCDRNGARILPILLASHMPLDLVVIMLGTNDLKPWICGGALGAAAGMRRLVQIVRTFPYDKPGVGMPQVLIVAPPSCRESGAGGPAAGRSIEESLKLAGAYRTLAAEVGAGFLDASTACRTSELDGVHLDAEQTAALGQALVVPIQKILA